MTARCTLYLTHYSEYMVRGDLCVGVRDRRSGSWQPFHAATRAYVLGSQTTLNSTPSTPWLGDGARIGERLCLRTSACQIVTGPIIAVETPSLRSIEEAEEQWSAISGARATALVTIPARSDLEHTRRDSTASE
jgi:hypothetical protein